MTCPYPPVPECLPTGNPAPGVVRTLAETGAVGTVEAIVAIILLAVFAAALFWLSNRTYWP